MKLDVTGDVDWARVDLPDWTVCECTRRGLAYRIQLTNGRAIKKHDPAWSMPEEVRSGNRSLRQQCRIRITDYYGYGPAGYFHACDSRKSQRGYPDLHVWWPGRGSLYRELKRMGKSPTAEQSAMMTRLYLAGHDVDLVRPCCLLLGVVDDVLAAFAGDQHPKGEFAPDRRYWAARTAEAVTAGSTEATARVRRALEVTLPGQPYGPDDVEQGSIGYVVPMSTAVCADSEAVDALNGWLRAHGIAVADVPYPMRIVVGPTTMAVQMRGPDRVRQWRGLPLIKPLDSDVPMRLFADGMYGPGPFMLDLLSDVTPSSELDLGLPSSELDLRQLENAP